MQYEVGSMAKEFREAMEAASVIVLVHAITLATVKETMGSTVSSMSAMCL